MSSESEVPHRQGGSGRVIVVLLALAALAGAGWAWWSLSSKGDAPVAPVQAPAKEVKRPTALAENELIVEVDAGNADEPKTPEDSKGKKPSTSSSADSWNCSGELDTDALRQMVAQHQTEIRSCYERRLKVNNQLQGNVSLILRITYEGKVNGTRVSGNLRDDVVYSCIKQIASGWAFEPPKTGGCAVVRIPYSFSPSP